jgi:small subunit ribosomal protein S9
LIDEETPTPDEPHADEPQADEPQADAPQETPAPAPEPEETPAEAPAAPEEPAPAEEPAAEAPAPEAPAPEAPAAPAEPAPAAEAQPEADEEPEAPREKPAIPGADLEVDLVIDSESDERPTYSEDGEPDDAPADDDEDVVPSRIAEATIDLGADARYIATGKRKTAIARVILRPGQGAYTINGKALDVYFPRPTLLRKIREPLETVGYEERMDVVASLQGGGVSSQAGALRHGISRALLEADPNLRTELKRRGFLTRDSRAKERKKAGLKKARKRPQFSKR